MCEIMERIAVEEREEGWREGRREGRREGEKDGELKKARETAEKLSSMGMEEELIAQAVGVELELVRKWLA